MATKDGRKSGGRKKGTPNKKTKEIIDKLEELNCDPIEGMASIARIAKTMGDFSLAGSMYKELAQYVYPKRKAVEHTKLNEAVIFYEAE